MKKKLVSVLVAVMAVAMLGGCGAKKNTVLKEMNVEKNVTVGEYKGLQVKVAPATVTDEEVATLVNDVYASYVTADNGGITNRAVEMGDTVNIDYEGKKDGVAFEGGTAAGQSLTIGSGRFIDGFEEGLVGVKPGETVDLDLKFPEEYHSAELAGQAVVFTVTVNFIMPTEKEDAVVATMGIEGVSNLEQLNQYAYDYLYQNAVYNYETNVQNAVMDAFMQNCQFSKVPEAMVEKYEKISRENIETTAASYGLDADTFTNYYYNMDMETFVKTYAEDAVKQDMAIQWVANAENLNITDEELDALLLEQAQSYGLSTIEEFIGDTAKEDYREYYLYDKILNFLIENAVITE